jgi:hypothetical protein
VRAKLLQLFERSGPAARRWPQAALRIGRAMMQRVLIGLVQGLPPAVQPLAGFGSCRLSPPALQYSLQALEQHGAAAG